MKVQVYNNPAEIYIKVIKISLKIQKPISQNSTVKKNTRLSFRQTIANYPVQNKHLKLRKYGLIRYRTSKEYYQLLNSNIKINNITITCDNGKYYAILNIEAPIEK